MLEARVHEQFKRLLHQGGSPLRTHHPGLSRLVAPSLQRHDIPLVSMDPGWRLSLPLPCAPADEPVALVAAGRCISGAGGRNCPVCTEPAGQHPSGKETTAPLRLLKPAQLLRTCRTGQLGGRRLAVPESGQLEKELRIAMGAQATAFLL